MNSPAVCTSITATLCATLAFASTQAMAAKPGGGGSTDCTAAVDFPAFAYWKPSGKTMQILVADAKGTCIRSVITSSGTGGTIQFSYPVSGTSNRGRVVWVAAPAVVSVDFTVDAVTKQITVLAKKMIYSRTGGFISLSKDGSNLYSTRYPDTGGLVIDKQALDFDGKSTGLPTTVFVAPNGSNVQTISVNSTEEYLVADYHPAPGAPTAPYQLVWVPLNGSNAVYLIDEHSAQVEFTPAANPSLPARVVSSDYIPVDSRNGGGCDRLVVRDITGNVIPDVGPPAYGVSPTWLNDTVVLADGRRANSTNGCEYSGTIMQLDLVSGVQTALTSGYAPDGK